MAGSADRLETLEFDVVIAGSGLARMRAALQAARLSAGKLKIFTAVLWMPWAPQLFAVAKGLCLAWTRGMAFGLLNPDSAAL